MSLSVHISSRQSHAIREMPGRVAGLGLAGRFNVGDVLRLRWRNPTMFIEFQPCAPQPPELD